VIFGTVRKKKTKKYMKKKELLGWKEIGLEGF
jgi:hypothetical protein